MNDKMPKGSTLAAVLTVLTGGSLFSLWFAVVGLVILLLFLLHQSFYSALDWTRLRTARAAQRSTYRMRNLANS